MLDKGLIVSIQGYSNHTTKELIEEALSGGAVAIRTDKAMQCRVPVIGLEKIHVNNPIQQPYITSRLDLVKGVAEWADYVAVDYRKENKEIKNISDYCRENKIKIIADIKDFNDFANIKKNNYYYTYVSTTLSVYEYDYRFTPNILLAKRILTEEENTIAEGNYMTRSQVRKALKEGVNYVCIGGAISNVFKLTKKFSTIWELDLKKEKGEK